jgi:hypothetical protein
MPAKHYGAAGAFSLLALAAIPALPQTNSAAAPVNAPQAQRAAPRPQGLQAPWDIRQMLAALNAQTAKMQPVLDNMHPQQWLDNGAPPAYVGLYQNTRTRLDDVIRAVKNLSQQTDSLSAALDTYFRMEALETSARSVYDCVKKYGERTSAEQLSALIAQNVENRKKFQDYLRDLSVEREQEFKIADEEAQRCRGMISRESPATSSRPSQKR